MQICLGKRGRGFLPHTENSAIIEKQVRNYFYPSVSNNVFNLVLVGKEYGKNEK